ncbi:MAG: hypothetical protein ACREYF_25690 [Gammaproteobacteria bacterium]
MATAKAKVSKATPKPVATLKKPVVKKAMAADKNAALAKKLAFAKKKALAVALAKKQALARAKDLEKKAALAKKKAAQQKIEAWKRALTAYQRKWEQEYERNRLAKSKKPSGAKAKPAQAPAAPLLK